MSGTDSVTWVDVSDSDCGNSSEMFYGLKNLEVVVAENTKFGRMTRTFKDCVKLKRIEGLGTWNDSVTIELRETFENCSSLTDLSGMAKWSDIRLGDSVRAFKGCSSLTDLSFLRSWTLKSGAIIDEMFEGCTSLRRVGLRGGPPEGLLLNATGSTFGRLYGS